MLSILFQLQLIKHSGTGSASEGTQRALKHLRHSESTRALGHSEGTQRALKGHSKGTWTLGDHLEGTRALKAFGLAFLGHSGTLAFRHLGNWAIKALGYSDT